MLCSPITSAATATASSSRAKLVVANTSAADTNNNNPSHQHNGLTSEPFSIVSINNNQSATSASIKHEPAMIATATAATTTTTPTTIREIKSKTLAASAIGSSLSPLYHQVADGGGGGGGVTKSAANPAALDDHRSISSGIERRQAVSMERLNSIHHSSPTNRQHLYGAVNRIGSGTLLFQRQQQQHYLKLQHGATAATSENTTANGSLSSGSNDSSLDDLSASDDQQQQQPQLGPERAGAAKKASSGLTRSASRVSRFRSAKEFFERLSSIQSHSTSTSPNKFEPRSPVLSSDRQRGIVLTRFAPVLASPITPTASRPLGSLLKQPASSGNNSGSNAATSSPPRSRLTPPSSAAPFLSRINHQPTQKQTPESTATVSTASGQAKRSEDTPAPAITQDLSKPQVTEQANLEAAPASWQPQGEPSPTRAIPKLALAYSNDSSGNNSSSSSNDGNSFSSCDSDINYAGGGSSAAEAAVGATSGGGEPCDVVAAFRGDNVIVGNGSLLNRRNKQLRIKFDENQPTSTFEYPSEEAMLAEPDSPPPGSPTPAQRASHASSAPPSASTSTSSSGSSANQEPLAGANNTKSKLPLRRVMTKLMNAR